MKKEKIEELYCANQTEFTYEDDLLDEMTLTDFTNAINQAELDWYKELEKKLNKINQGNTIAFDLDYYQTEIQNKIKGLENEN